MENKCRRIIISGVASLVLLGSAGLAFHQDEGLPLLDPLEVMTYNIGDLNTPRPSVEDVAKVIKKHGVPDLLMIQEITGEKATSRLSGILDLPHFLYSSYRGKKSGVAILSRLPITESGTYFFEESKKGLGILTGELSINGQNIRVCVLHLDRIGPVKKRGQAIEMSWKSALGFLKTELLEETVRSRSVDELLAWLSKGESGNVIIGGDFNTVPFSRAIRKMNQTFDDALWPSWNYLTSSYQKFPLPVSPRIDYIFHSPGMKCSNATVIKEGPGDHYPVKAVFSIRAT